MRASEKKELHLHIFTLFQARDAKQQEYYYYKCTNRDKNDK